MTFVHSTCPVLGVSGDEPTLSVPEELTAFQALLQAVAKRLRHCIENSLLLPKSHLPLHKESLNALTPVNPFPMLIPFSVNGKCRGEQLCLGGGVKDTLTWMTRIVRFITVSVSTLFAIACFHGCCV